MVQPSYKPLPTSESTEKLLYNADLRQTRTSFVRRLLPWLAHVAFLTLSLTILFSGLYFHRQAAISCIEKVSAYSPALSTIEYHDVKYNGSLEWPSPFRGKPSPEVDEAWLRLTDVSLFSIDEATVQRIGKDPATAVKLPPSQGGGYLAAIEASHQLHCVNLLRMYTHFDHYAALEPAFSDPPDMVRTHIDHCLEMLRIILSCHADPGIVTFSWVEGHAGPMPDFNTVHRCRRVDPVLEWARERALPDGVVRRPEGEGVVEVGGEEYFRGERGA